MYNPKLSLFLKKGIKQIYGKNGLESFHIQQMKVGRYGIPNKKICKFVVLIFRDD